MNQDQKHQVGDRMLADMFVSMGLDVDGKAIAAAVRQRKFEGAQFVAVALATAAMVESGIDDVEHAINVAIDEMNRRQEAALRYLEKVMKTDRSGPTFYD